MGQLAPDDNAADAHTLTRLGADYMSERVGLTKRVAEVLGKLQP